VSANGRGVGKCIFQNDLNNYTQLKTTMPKTIPNYQQGKVYKMTIGDLIYIGSTCQKYLCQRQTQHTKSYNYWVKYKDKRKKVCYATAYELYKIGKPTITLLENCPCKSKDELLACEYKYIQQFKCVNQRMKETPPMVGEFNRKEYEKQYKEQHMDAYKASYRKSYEKRRRLERLTLFIHKHIEFVQNRI